MAGRTVRIGDKAGRTLRLISTRTGETMQKVLDRALESYRRQVFLDDANSAFAALKSDKRAWAAEVEERAAWDITLGDEDDK